MLAGGREGKGRGVNYKLQAFLESVEDVSSMIVECYINTEGRVATFWDGI